MKRTILVFLITLGIILSGCQTIDPVDQTHNEPEPSQMENPEQNTENDINQDEAIKETNEEILAEDVAEEIVLSLSNQDMQTLATYIHPSQGVRFSPYSYVDIQEDLVFSTNQINGIFNDSTVYHWGTFDGSGDPIDMTFADYYARFVYDQDYANPEQIAVNDMLGGGNTIDNTGQVYPNATVVVFHFSGFDPQYEGLDWRSLRLALEQVGNQWFLVGIIHDEWTI